MLTENLKQLKSNKLVMLQWIMEIMNNPDINNLLDIQGIKYLDPNMEQ